MGMLQAHKKSVSHGHLTKCASNALAENLCGHSPLEAMLTTGALALREWQQVLLRFVAHMAALAHG
jgi:hypothetical protein